MVSAVENRDKAAPECSFESRTRTVAVAVVIMLVVRHVPTQYLIRLRRAEEIALKRGAHSADPILSGDRAPRRENRATVAGDRGFESVSLQRGVRGELGQQDMNAPAAAEEPTLPFPSGVAANRQRRVDQEIEPIDGLFD